MQITRSSDGAVLEVSEILKYRCSTIASAGKPITWHKWAMPECVALHFGMDYEELTAHRSTDEWNEFAKQWAADNNIDFKHVKGAGKQPRNGALKKSDYEELGRELVTQLEYSSSPSEADDEEYQTTKEWVDENYRTFLDGSNFTVSTRPIKPKKTTQIQQKIDDAVDEELEAAKQKLRDAGIDEEAIAKAFA